MKKTSPINPFRLGEPLKAWEGPSGLGAVKTGDRPPPKIALLRHRRDSPGHSDLTIIQAEFWLGGTQLSSFTDPVNSLSSFF